MNEIADPRNRVKVFSEALKQTLNENAIIPKFLEESKNSKENEVYAAYKEVWKNNLAFLEALTIKVEIDSVINGMGSEMGDIEDAFRKT